MANQEGATREFDDEQYKLEEGDDEGDTDMQTMERANELARQYEDIKDRTLGENLVAGRLEDIDTSPANNNIVVIVDLPGEGNYKKFRFKKPKVWSREYDFVRWIQYYGYDADSFPNMLKGQCDVEVKNLGDEKYELFIPEYDNRREHIKDVFSGSNGYIETLLHTYRQEDNNLFFAPLLIFAHVIHGAFWLTPLIDYGFEGLISFSFWSVWLIVLFAFWFIEDTIKTK